MGAESNAIAEHIEAERAELGQDIRELEKRVRAEPRRWLEKNLPRIAGIAFAVLFLVGFTVAGRRARPMWGR